MDSQISFSAQACFAARGGGIPAATRDLGSGTGSLRGGRISFLVTVSVCLGCFFFVFVCVCLGDLLDSMSKDGIIFLIFYYAFVIILQVVLDLLLGYA